MPSLKPVYHYVYILESVADPSRHYTGCTTDLNARLNKHNKGDVPHTSKYRPWRVETAIRYSAKEKAGAFEAYRKSGSGRKFSRRHF
jgi:predicted GIY-YIG superfamily endonuclease